MRLLFFFLLSLLFLLSPAQNWQSQQFVQIGLSQAVFWNDTGIVIGAQGYIIHTNDFFHSFVIDSTYTTNQFEAISFPVRNHGYITSPQIPGGLLISDDAGVKWIPDYGCEYLKANFGDVVVFVGIDTGYCAVSVGNEYLETDDGGINWKVHAITLPNCKRIFQINIISDTIFYALGNDEENWASDGDLRLFTSKGINGTWQELFFFPSSIGYGDFKFIDDSLVIFSAGNNISKSIDAGNTFETVMQSTAFNDNYDLPGQFISFINHDTGFVAFAASVYRTYDAGTTWQQTAFVFDSTDFDNQIRFIKAVSSQKVVVGCENGNIYKTETGGGIAANVPEVSNNYQLSLYPNPATTQLLISTNNFNPQTITIYNLNGQRVLNLPFAHEVDIAALPPGVYFVEVTGKEATEVRKLVKM